MVKLTSILKERTEEQKMIAALNERQVESELRAHLGLSMIGNKCRRFLQLNHYDTFTVSHSVRILRLFNEGHRMEPVMRAELLDKLGIDSFADQDQVVGFAGHWMGHIDGLGKFEKASPFHHVIEGEFLTEFKTHNDKSFKDLVKNKVEKSKPVHYGQVQAYMGYKGVDFCLYVAYNKNDSEMYVEIIPFNKEYFKEEVQRKEGEVIMADALLPRIGNDSQTWFECKLCDARKTCFGKKEIKKSCKNCQHVDIHDGGLWTCGKGNNITCFQPCEHYELMEMLCQLD